MKRARAVFAFPNGMVAVTDDEGHQIPELQGRALDVIGLVLAECDELTTFRGVIDLQMIRQQIADGPLPEFDAARKELIGGS
jgi:hypothetical protein